MLYLRRYYVLYIRHIHSALLRHVDALSSLDAPRDRDVALLERYSDEQIHEAYADICRVLLMSSPCHDFILPICSLRKDAAHA